MAYHRSAWKFSRTKCTGSIRCAGTLRRQNALSLLGSASILKHENEKKGNSTIPTVYSTNVVFLCIVSYSENTIYIQESWDIGGY